MIQNAHKNGEMETQPQSLCILIKVHWESFICSKEKKDITEAGATVNNFENQVKSKLGFCDLNMSVWWGIVWYAFWSLLLEMVNDN